MARDDLESGSGRAPLAPADPLGGEDHRRGGRVHRPRQDGLGFLVALTLLFLGSFSSVIAQEDDEEESAAVRLKRLERLITRRNSEVQARAEAEMTALVLELEERPPGEREDQVLHDAAMALQRRARGDEDRLRWLETASRAALALNLQDLHARAQHPRALILLGQGRYRDAERILEETLLSTPDDRGLHPSLTLLLAECASRTGDDAKALSHLDQLDAMVKADIGTVDSPLLRYAVILRIRSLLQLGLSRQAALLLRPHLEEVEALPDDDPGKAEALRNAHLSQLTIALETEDFDLVKDRVPRYRERAEVYGDDPAMRGQLDLILAIALAEEDRLASGNPSRAEPLLRTLLGNADLTAPVRCDVETKLAEILAARGEWSEAEELIGHAREGLDSRSAPEPAPAEESAQLATLAARIALDRGDGPEVLRQRLQELGSLFDRLLDRWSKLPRPPGGVDFLNFGHRLAVPAEVIRLSVALDPEGRGEEHAFSCLLRLQEQGTLARRCGVVDLDLETVRDRLLAPGRGILVYLPGPYRSHVFALDGQDLVHQEIADRDVIEPIRRSHLTALSTDLRDLADPKVRTSAVSLERKTAHRLSDLLLPATIREILSGWDAVTIVGADLLGPVPFEWLPVGEAAHVGVEKAIDYLPSCPLGIFLSRRAEARRATGAPSLDILFVGDPIPTESPEGSPLLPLPVPEDLRAALTATYPEGQVRFLLGDAATPGNLLRQNLPDVALLQLVVHGVRDDGRGIPAGLQLSASAEDPAGRIFGDAIDRGEALSTDRHDAPRAVLITACRSGQGPLRRGDAAVADLGGSFLAAGAQAVLLSQGDLSLNPTLELTAVLHRHLSRGASLAEAMRLTRKELTGNDPELAPFRFGLLQVVGLGHEALVGPVTGGAMDVASSKGLLLLLGLAAVAVLLGAVLLRRPRSA